MTKRIPGAKRGRPPKPKPPKRERGGRPPVPLREHPDGYLVARYDVASVWLSQIPQQSSQHKRAEATVVIHVMNLQEPITEPRWRRSLDALTRATADLREMARRC